MKRVVVTGIGIVSPLGCGNELVWNRLLEGRSGIHLLNKEKGSFENIPVSVVATVPRGNNIENGEFDILSLSDRRDIIKEISIVSLYAMYASDLALKQARIGNGFGYALDGDRSGVAIASGIGALEDIVEGARSLAQSYRKLSPYFVPKVLANSAAGHVSLRHNLRGPNHTVSTACAAGSHAIGDAYNWIRLGYASTMLAGGTEACITPLALAGFCRMKALSLCTNPEQASRPFDQSRDGFVMGEGATVLVLEELSLALARGAPIVAELCGYGVSADAHHMTTPAVDGDGAIRAMRSALQDAHLSPQDISYVNAHATSTPIGDAIEARAIDAVFGLHGQQKEQGLRLRVSSTKGATGHLLGAAGALEAAFTALAARDGLLPPTLNFSAFDLGLTPTFTHVTTPAATSTTTSAAAEPVDTLSKATATTSGAAEEGPVHCMSNSFGFGGTNSSLVFKRFTG